MTNALGECRGGAGVSGRNAASHEAVVASEAAVDGGETTGGTGPAVNTCAAEAAARGGIGGASSAVFTGAGVARSVAGDFAEWTCVCCGGVRGFGGGAIACEVSEETVDARSAVEAWEDVAGRGDLTEVSAECSSVSQGS